MGNSRSTPRSARFDPSFQNSNDNSNKNFDSTNSELRKVFRKLSKKTNSLKNGLSSSRRKNSKSASVNIELNDDCREELTEILKKLNSNENSISLTTNDISTISALVSHHENILSHEIVEKDIRGSLINYDLTAPKYVSFFKSYYAKSARAPSIADQSDDEHFEKSKHERRRSSMVADEEKVEVDKISLTLEIKKLKEMANFREFSFNIWNLKNITPYPLLLVSETALEQMNLIEHFDISEYKLRNFFMSIQNKYNNVPYHNCYHAADVTQAVFSMGVSGHLFQILNVTKLQKLAIIIAAAIHDVGHPGRTGKFLVATAHKLAILYNDISPLENMHLATAFEIWLESKNNFTKLFQPSVFQELRKLIIDLVLATDNDQHFELTSNMNTVMVAATTAQKKDVEKVERSNNLRNSLEQFGSGPSSRGGGGGGVNFSPNVLEKANTVHGTPTPLTVRDDRDANRRFSTNVFGQSTKRRSSFASAAINLVNGNSNNESIVLQNMLHSNSPLDENSINGKSNKHISGTLSNIFGNTTNHFSTDNSSIITSQTTESLITSSSKKVPALRLSTGFSSVSNNNLLGNMSLTPRALRSSGMTAINNNIHNNNTPHMPSSRVASIRESHQTGTQESEFGISPSSRVPSPSNAPFVFNYTQVQINTSLKSLLHAADISTAARPWEIYTEWSKRVLEEFYSEGDDQRDKKMEITFAFDRYHPEPLHKFQTGFIKVIVQPIYIVLSKLPGAELQICLDNINKNLAQWEIYGHEDTTDNVRQSMLTSVHSQIPINLSQSSIQALLTDREHHSSSSPSSSLNIFSNKSPGKIVSINNLQFTEHKPFSNGSQSDKLSIPSIKRVQSALLSAQSSCSRIALMSNMKKSVSGKSLASSGGSSCRSVFSDNSEGNYPPSDNLSNSNINGKKDTPTSFTTSFTGTLSSLRLTPSKSLKSSNSNTPTSTLKPPLPEPSSILKNSNYGTITPFKLLWDKIDDEKEKDNKVSSDAREQQHF